jgi:hypothetical protein
MSVAREGLTDTDHFMVRIKYMQRISLARRGRAEKITIFNTEILKDEVTRKVFEGRLKGRNQ